MATRKKVKTKVETCQTEAPVQISQPVSMPGIGLGQFAGPRRGEDYAAWELQDLINDFLRNKRKYNTGHQLNQIENARIHFEAAFDALNQSTIFPTQLR